ncbi:MAG: hypothetical protein CMI74_09510 [Candidatus Pelagibacter sp.]|nr:hypothetical protein [Candidatus Pelagibacter sp.]|tara:strand:- start:6671 stop:6937 length:267 start_codon:yes stop_codon:yes gene_type:complete
MNEKQFNDLMLQIITNVIEEKHEKHFVYNRIFKKLMMSDKTNKLKLAKYLLGRLLRESYRIFFNAQINATQNCPHQKKFSEPGKIVYH